METLAEDLLLLSLNPATGRVVNPQRIIFGLTGAELVRLAAYGRVDIRNDQILVRDQTPTGDPLLDSALTMLARQGPFPVNGWVRWLRADLYAQYMRRLLDEGAIRQQMFKYARILNVAGFAINDPGRLAAARARLDAIALSDGPVTAAQAALGGLAVAVAVDQYVYPGWGGRKARKRLARVSRGEVPAAVAEATKAAVRPAGADQSWPELIPPVLPGQESQHRPGHPGHPHQVQPGAPGATAAGHAAGAAGQAATQAATDAATHAATQAATHAATHAATQAAVHAATHAAVSAAHSAASHASSGGHGHGGGGGGHHGGGGGGDHGGGGGHHH